MVVAILEIEYPPSVHQCFQFPPSGSNLGIIDAPWIYLAVWVAKNVSHFIQELGILAPGSGRDITMFFMLFSHLFTCASVWHVFADGNLYTTALLSWLRRQEGKATSLSPPVMLVCIQAREPVTVQSFWRAQDAQRSAAARCRFWRLWMLRAGRKNQNECQWVMLYCSYWHYLPPPLSPFSL